MYKIKLCVTEYRDKWKDNLTQMFDFKILKLVYSYNRGQPQRKWSNQF